jgi:hypothetical protein
MGAKEAKSKSESWDFGHTTKGRHIDSLDKLADIVAAYRTIGARLVLTQGTFDFIHIYNLSNYVRILCIWFTLVIVLVYFHNLNPYHFIMNNSKIIPKLHLLFERYTVEVW